VSGLAPTICEGRLWPGYGLRVRFDSKAKDLAAADFSCPCGHAEDAVGHTEVETLVIRFGRHQRDECPIPEVRAAAARHYAALQQSLNKRRRK
jgi:hypothetical protein